MQLSIENIKDLLATNDKAVGRALLVLRNRQTADEKVSETTKHQNGRGFRPCHARMGTNMADFFERKGYLSPKQVAYWRAPMKDGNSRIEIYSRQLLEEAVAKAQAKVYAALQTQKAAAIELDEVIDTTDDFNKKWFELKNEFGQQEAEAERRAYEREMQIEMALEAAHGY